MTSVNGILCFSLNLEAPVKQKRLVCSTTHKAVLPPPCGMPGVVDRTGSALRTKRTGLRYLRLGFLLGCTRADFGFTLTRGATRVVGRRRGPATSGGDFQPRLRAAMWSCDLRFPPRAPSSIATSTRDPGPRGLRVTGRVGLVCTGKEQPVALNSVLPQPFSR